MSNTPTRSLQLYTSDGTPIPPAVNRERLVDLARGAYERSGTHLDRDVVDLHLAESADKAACSLLRDQWTDGFPIAAYTELLTAVAALRSILGYFPTPTARDVNAWARALRDASMVEGEHQDLHEVRLCEGPHRGAVVALWGAKTPQKSGARVGPPLALELQTERGDSTNLEFGTAYYKRCREPNPSTGTWEYILDRDRPFPAEGSRPHMLGSTPNPGGAP
ncbi:hypothetical protein AB0D73_29365 [Streptomyces sp. NPDC048215]|uniref:hypothetical protein n=1 Tax=Streptomyces sp. NPDC048215 TaxID=3156690 RepID=UPI0034070827